jgi:hypothetical protein
MGRVIRRRLVAMLLLGATAAQVPRAARAQDSEACATAYVGAQRLRLKAELRAAREQLLLCSKDSCAAALRQDCVRWLAENDATMPSVVFAVRGPRGDDVTAVRVAMDGAPLVDQVGGLAVSVDPGPHTFRFEMQGAAPVEQRVVVREGERARLISASFAPPPSVPPATPERRGVPLWLDATVGGVGVVLAGVGTYFEFAGLSGKRDLDACKGSCTQDAIDSNRSTFRAGDILIGAGLVALAVGAYLYFFQRPAVAR